ncbi:hypothetical protein HG264_16600 [Pseudomonas sp. gcc21]|uniref:hypothetical protein n=1 Tax=Pseudomonas sp. gcc21 TaxID=2726989 RepID=UPI0014510FA2|nr:hypothetical protein [Pseudomonas sp. gcc21]QJD60378.1 hypothetical protein HG264_16600 [Pseudomonas sp. gcc21]
MVGKAAVTVILLALLATGLFFFSDAADEPLYSRQDCIQKVVFDWGDRSSTEIEEVISEMADALRIDWTKKDPNVTTNIPDFSFPYAQRNEWYLQYREGCEQKRTQTVELIERVLAPSISEMPGYMITDEQVTPSPKTIDVRGEQWKDDGY